MTSSVKAPVGVVKLPVNILSQGRPMNRMANVKNGTSPIRARLSFGRAAADGRAGVAVVIEGEDVTGCGAGLCDRLAYLMSSPTAASHWVLIELTASVELGR